MQTLFFSLIYIIFGRIISYYIEQYVRSIYLMKDVLYGVYDTKTELLFDNIIDRYNDFIITVCWPMFLFFIVGYTIGEKKFIKDAEKRNYPLDLMVYKSWYDRNKTKQ